MSEMLTTEGLSKHFGGLKAVDKVRFTIRKDEATGVIGPNGSGKTTLFNLLSGLFPPTEGRIVFQGEDITSIPPNAGSREGWFGRFSLSPFLAP